jgi:hypothetical protein
MGGELTFAAPVMSDRVADRADLGEHALEPVTDPYKEGNVMGDPPALQGAMFWLTLNKLSGSYLRLISTSRSKFRP